MHLELLQRAARNPDDEASWRVLADVLMDVGDPRGEFIALSMKRTQSATLKKKLIKLLKRHRLEWLGPLASVVVPDVERDLWENGFPVRLACSLKGSTVGASQWLTVREVVLVAPEEEGAVPLELLAETTPNLRAISLWPARWSSREGLVQAPRWLSFAQSWLTHIGRAQLLEVPSLWARPMERGDRAR